MALSTVARTNLLVTVIVALSACIHASPFFRRSDHPSSGKKSADFIIIGGGTAGLTVAARLVEADFTVLVLEAGGFPDSYGLPWDSPALTGEMTDTPVDWNFTSLAIPGLNGRTVAQHQGFCLGGTSSINGLTYGRGSRSIYDNWEAIGNPGWGWDDVQEYFERTWKLVPPPNDAHYRTYDPSLYDPNAGPGELGYTNFNPPSIDAFVESLPSIGIPISLDLNSGNNIGGKHELSTLDPLSQTRISSYTAFWNTVVGRSNFEAITFAVVEKILFRSADGKEGSSQPVAYGVEYSTTINGQKRKQTAYANKEVILSAGTIQTPKVLMLSGIGPRQTLQDLEIPVVYDNEWVGKNLRDSPSFSMIVKTTDEASTNKFQHNMNAIQAAMAEKASDPTSSSNPLNAIDGNSGPAYSFAKLSTSDLEDTGASYLLANQSDQAHYEVILWTSLYPLPDNVPTLNNYYDFSNYTQESYVSLASYLLVPGTGGNVTINSRDVSSPPLINLPFYELDADLNIQILSLKRLRTLISQSAFAQYTLGPAYGEIVPGPDVQTDEDIANFIRETSVSAAHQAGTAAMRPLDDEGVVSPSLEVYGVQGLRVVDASVMPLFVDQHPTAAIYMIAEKAAQMIKDKYGAE
ncbi:hypothetical protein G647_05169 [Cladophialophora carrionii CBS 160.54]|uniref:Glucose-methanol-choline oxidoreductase N-terminal domain-containing protein n=1 Tax=Cladophialophora carrionii CBS 160.54 TaxID=1279043 RepID=V9DAQ0_9EURO|nr:uncharacterized protein G647_05169 [Cladophialophora carrionii CBS 160.54]ETI23368.1 hypothetical protein G647_05169 [Cladophialophora carrionii CBS 160.54]